MAYNNLLIHDVAKVALEALQVSPPQGLLLVGPEGIGKLSIATAWARSIVDHDTNMRVISPDEKGTIPIETIRELYKTTRAKQEGRQIVILDRADGMSLEAENAFLKLLEEPREGLTFILTAQLPESLLPTILSRVQHITLQALPDEVIRQAIVAKKPGISQNDLSQLVFLAQGRPGIALSLLVDDALPKQRARMQIVKQLITAKPYERFSLINQMATDKEGCVSNLNAMSRIVEVQMTTAHSKAQLSHWLTLASALDEALWAITHNGNVRAQLLHLFSRY